MADQPRRGLPLHHKILLGLVLGGALGTLANLYGPDLEAGLSSWVGEPVEIVRPLLQYVMEPVGQIFLNMLLMTVVPLVFSSLAVGVARLGDLRHLGRVGAKTFGYFVLTMSLAVAIGLALVNAVRPGAGLPEETRRELLAAYGGETSAKLDRPAPFGVQTLVDIVPRNPLKAAVEMDMLSVIFFALLIGVGLTIIPPERSRLLVQGLEGVNDLMVVIIDLAMRLAPYGVFAFLFRATASFGFALLQPLGLYVLVVVAGLGVQMFVVFPVLVRLMARVSPWEFFRRVRVVVVTAFSTSSSSATLPTSIKVAEEELGVPPQVAGFVLPMGATMNMNGTALFEGVTVVFLAQVFGVALQPVEQLIVIVLSVLMAVGAAGVPGGSIPLLAMVLTAVNVPAEGIAVIIGVDRLLDMCRTTLNVVGDLTAAAFIARSEGHTLMAPSVNGTSQP